MSEGPRLPYAEALALAQRVVAILAPAWERAEIAGSLRRGCATIGDIDLVAIPRPAPHERPVFGRPITQGSRSPIAQRLSAAGGEIVNDSEHIVKARLDDLVIDVWLSEPAQWGYKLAIRTGPLEFSKWLVSRQPRGACPRGWRFEGGYLWHGEKIVPCPEEADLFAALGLAWIPPEERSAGRWGTRR